jgi:hypothetical protein
MHHQVLYSTILRSAHTVIIGYVLCVDLTTNGDLFPYTALTDWLV